VALKMLSVEAELPTAQTQLKVGEEQSDRHPQALAKVSLAGKWQMLIGEGSLEPEEQQVFLHVRWDQQTCIADVS
jgi:hypothetical protein